MDNAELIRFDLPVQVTVGQSFSGSVTIRNSGTTAWTPGGVNPHILGTQDPADNSLWGVHRFPLPGPVSPGATVVVPLNLKAPLTSGPRELTVQMVWELVKWFGNKMRVTIPVVSSPTPPPPPPPVPGMVFPKPAASPYPDSCVTWTVFNTGIVDVDRPPANIQWINDTGKRLLLRHARIWAGLGVGQINDVNAELTLISNRGLLCHFQEDHYAQRNAPVIQERYYAVDEKVYIMPGDGVNLGYYANRVAGPLGGKAHFSCSLSVQSFDP